VPKRTLQQPAPNIVINNPPAQSATEILEPEKPQEREEKEPGWFFGEINKIPTNEWEKIFHLEIQRLEPKVPGVAGSKGYLWTFFAPITLADVKKRWGGGKFRLDLCKNGHYYRTHNFDIEGEPIYDRSREIPPANGNNGNGIGSNADFQKEFISVLREELQRSRESNNGQVGSEHVIEMLTKASERAMEIVTKQAPAPSDPTAQLNGLLAAAEKIANLRAPASNGTTLTEAITLLSSLGVLQKPKTLTEQIADAKALKDLLTGVAEAEPGDWKSMLAKAAVEHAPEILDALKPQPRPGQPQQPARPGEPLRTTPINQPRQAQPAAQHAAPAAPAVHVEGGLKLESRDVAPVAAAAEVMPPSQPAPVPVSQEQYDEGMKVQVVNMFRYGASGSAIAAFLEDIKPELAEDIAKYPAQTITEFFGKDPILRLMIADPRWPEVLADAREYLAEEVPAN
jgi:hypothetical protein